MKPNWILVANAAHARLFRQDAGEPLVTLKSFEHPASRQHSAVLGDDKAGKELSGRGFGGAAFEPRVDAQTKEHLHFAHELAATLEHGAQEGAYESLVVYASNPFLGELKQQLGEHARSHLSATHDVDLTSFGLAEIEQRIQQQATH